VTVTSRDRVAAALLLTGRRSAGGLVTARPGRVDHDRLDQAAGRVAVGHREERPVSAEAVRLRACQQRGALGEQPRGVTGGGGGLGDGRRPW
jgi:hypothetical protein